jgi:hypothetical protein
MRVLVTGGFRRRRLDGGDQRAQVPAWPAPEREDPEFVQ